LYCDGSQGIGGKTVMSESLAVHVHGVLDFLRAVKEKVLTLSNPIFLPTAYFPAVVCFGRE
jgi:hypothetical protein